MWLWVAIGLACFLLGYWLVRAYMRRQKIQALLASKDLKEVAELFRIKPLQKNVEPPITMPGFRSDDDRSWKQRKDVSLRGSALEQMRILSWNVCFSSERRFERAESLLASIAKEDADVVCLQEMQAPVLNLFKEKPSIQSTYDLSHFSIQAGYTVVLLTKRKLNCKFTWLKLPSRMGRVTMFGSLNVDGGKEIRIGSSHLESLRCPDERALQAERSLPLCDVFIGDMNCDAAWKEPLEDVVAAAGFRDAWGDRAEGYTRNEKRIDRAFVSEHIEVVDVRVLDGRDVSDHHGLVVDIQL